MKHNHSGRNDKDIFTLNGDTAVGIYKNIKLNDINYLSHQSRVRKATYLSGSIIYFCGAVLLISSPFISHIFKKESFNKDKFTTYAGLGLAGICVGIPLQLLGRPRQYKVTSRGAKKEKDYWYFETNENNNEHLIQNVYKKQQ